MGFAVLYLIHTRIKKENRERERESAYRPLYLKSSPKLRSVVCPWCYDDFDSLMTISMCNSYGSSYVLFSRIPLLFLLHECIGLRKYSMLLSMFFFFFFFDWKVTHPPYFYSAEVLFELEFIDVYFFLLVSYTRT